MEKRCNITGFFLGLQMFVLRQEFSLDVKGHQQSQLYDNQLFRGLVLQGTMKKTVMFNCILYLIMHSSKCGPQCIMGNTNLDEYAIKYTLSRKVHLCVYVCVS